LRKSLPAICREIQVAHNTCHQPHPRCKSPHL
jgi:hypothetical protein